MKAKAQTAQKKVLVTVTDQAGETLPGANVIILGKDKGLATDLNGRAQLSGISAGDTIQVSFTGFSPTKKVFAGQSSVTIALQEGVELETVEVKGGSKFVDTKTLTQSEYITAEELKHAACCNLSESFETNASVDVSQSDAATGAKQIRFLGLSGKYTQIQVDNIPTIRGLNSAYGLTYVPGTWVAGIDVNKGAGSITNGYESMTGQINVRLLQPDKTEKLYLNAYGNSLGRAELNVHTGHKINDKWSSSLLVHGNILESEIDRNDDGFLDAPKSKQINVLNRWKYEGDKVMGNWGVQVMADSKLGGQKGFSRDDDNKTSQLYGIGVDTKKIDFFGKNGFNQLGGTSDNLAVFYSVSYMDVDSYYGRRDYSGQQLSAYFNSLYLTQIGSDRHKIATGTSLTFDKFDEELDRLDPQLNRYDWSRNETVVGAFFEYTGKFTDRLTGMASARYDYNSIYDGQFTPRFHLKYEIKDGTVLRASAGKGVRTPNPVAENTRFLVSNREVYMDENLDQEVSWNYGVSFQHEFYLFDRKASFVTDYYYTHFNNKLIVDMDTDPNKVFFQNLDGSAYAHSFQAELSFEPLSGLSASTAYKLYDVRQTINGDLQQMPLVPRHRFFLNLGYETVNEKWRFDWTGHFFGEKRMPHTENKPTEYQQDEYSPAFFTMHAQASYKFSDKLEIYVGGENLGNYTQDDPVIAPGDPFGENFDASMNWGPVIGTMIYTGIRWNVL
ncbi:TonB-dependent receptor (plasmid) [Fulvitalea axinellae]|uniref:TonB-dependent receptor n=1 Tax=Fulvitalea axinellae TaxID=1182444 RepID=A0AAU9D8R4_9BACT|nr:TonB-dependent receptor [Fulvitalea axinellae]